MVSPSVSPVLIAHGRRGDDAQQPISERRAWFSRLAADIPLPDKGAHINFPYHSGDIIWAVNNDSVTPSITIQDPEGRIAGLWKSEPINPLMNSRGPKSDRSPATCP